jgi:hypothetical protein
MAMVPARPFGDQPLDKVVVDCELAGPEDNNMNDRPGGRLGGGGVECESEGGGENGNRNGGGDEPGAPGNPPRVATGAAMPECGKHGLSEC